MKKLILNKDQDRPVRFQGANYMVGIVKPCS